MTRRGRALLFVLAVLIASLLCEYPLLVDAKTAPAATPMPMSMPMTGTQQQQMSNPEEAPASPVSGTQWSVFNHRGAGLFIFLWGLTALIAGLQLPRRTWIRFVPGLVLLGLAEFLFLRNDPKAWPTGPYGFWESMRDPAVVQHRVFVLLILAIAIVELFRAADRLPPLLQRFALPALAAFGGVYLFFHTHGGWETQQMMRQMNNPQVASNPVMQQLMSSMKSVKREHLIFSLLGFGLAAAKLAADNGLLRGKFGATLWSFFAIALGLYMIGYSE